MLFLWQKMYTSNIIQRLKTLLIAETVNSYITWLSTDNGIIYAVPETLEIGNVISLETQQWAAADR